MECHKNVVLQLIIQSQFYCLKNVHTLIFKILKDEQNH